jgi:ADP-ribose pyrophosphatase YjhB (NUDIX family)
VEPGEEAEAAARREAEEETRLVDLGKPRLLRVVETALKGGARQVVRETPVFSQPRGDSFAWAKFRRGIQVRQVRREGAWVQAEYIEYDREPARNYVTYHILGWVLEEALSEVVRRAFFVMEYAGPTPERWHVATDNHTFELFWARLDALPEIIPPQDEWVKVLKN